MGRCSGIRAVFGGLALTACSLGAVSCHLLDSYSVGDRSGTDSGTASPDVDARGGFDTGSPGDSGSAPDSADATQDTADATDGITQEPCPDESGVYCLQRATPSSVSIDGNCSVAEFGEGDETRMPIKAPGDQEPPGKNPTDNVIDCRARWLPGDRPQVHFCCDVEDSDPVYSAGLGEPVGKIWGEGSYDPDDRFEFGRRGDQMPQKDGGRKLFLNIRQEQPVHYDAAWGDSGRDSGRLSEFEGASVWGNGGYVVEWKIPLGVSVEAGDAALCNFMHQDVDIVNESPERQGAALLWGEGLAINEPEQWKTCFYR